MNFDYQRNVYQSQTKIDIILRIMKISEVDKIQETYDQLDDDTEMVKNIIFDLENKIKNEEK